MSMKQFPKLFELKNGLRYWTHSFDTFRVKVLVPEAKPLSGIINFGFRAPYPVVFEEEELTPEQAALYAEQTKLLSIAAGRDASVVFLYPTAEGGWKNAPDDIYASLIAETRIHQYYRDGVVNMRDRFTKQWQDHYIRGAIFRCLLYGKGKAADYIAEHLLRTVQGQYLWGPGEITPAAVTLEGLSKEPVFERRDIPVVSVGNSDKINHSVCAQCDHVLIRDSLDAEKDFVELTGRFRRWCGKLEEENGPEALGMAEEPGYEWVLTGMDNRGDFANEPRHRVGFIAWYDRDLFDHGKVPLLLAFHGGGDSAYYISLVSGWYRVAHRNRFLLVALENHLDTTAGEIRQLLEKLKKRYPIDENRVYASGFSMGGCKSWDLMQEEPRLFAALAPMDATFEVGLNQYGEKASKEINHTVPVPVFYAGGEITPLPELPFQAEKCRDRIEWLFHVNRVNKKYDAPFSDQSHWEDPIWGVRGDRVEKIEDPSRGSVLTMHLFESEDGVCRTVLASVSGQGHECREHTCEQAWQFMSRFTLEET